MKLFGNPNAGKKNNSRGKGGSQTSNNSKGQAGSQAKKSSGNKGNSGGSSFGTGPTGLHGFPTDQKYNPSAQQQQTPNVPPPGYTEAIISHAGPSATVPQSSYQGNSIQQQPLQNTNPTPSQSTQPQAMQSRQQGFPQQQAGFPQQYGNMGFSGSMQPGTSSPQTQGKQPGPPSSITPSQSASQVGSRNNTVEDNDIDFEYPYQEPQIQGASNHMQQGAAPTGNNQAMAPYQNPDPMAQMPQQNPGMPNNTTNTQMTPMGQQHMGMAQNTGMGMNTLPVGVPMAIGIPPPTPISINISSSTSTIPRLHPLPPPLLLPKIRRLIRDWERGFTFPTAFSARTERAIEAELSLLYDAALLCDADPRATGIPESEVRYMWGRAREVGRLLRYGPEWGVDYSWLGMVEEGPAGLVAGGMVPEVEEVRRFWGGLRGRSIRGLGF